MNRTQYVELHIVAVLLLLPRLLAVLGDGEEGPLPLPRHEAHPGGGFARVTQGPLIHLSIP